MDLTGKQFGRLTVVRLYSRSSRKPTRPTMWLCKCECGNEVVVRRGNLLNGNTKSCGCLRTDNMGAYTPNANRLWNSWRSMRFRCNNKASNRYHLYGGRGIKVCEDWDKSFEAFKEWSLQNGYADNLTIDRIDVNGDYRPENCRWIPIEEQGRNKRTNRLLIHNGETRTLAEWARVASLNEETLRSRLKRGWSVEKALTTPVKVEANNEQGS